VLDWQHLGLQPRGRRVLEGAHHAGQEREQKQEKEGVVALARDQGHPGCERRQQDGGGQHDPPPAVAVGDMAAVQDQADARNCLDQTEPSEVERIMRQPIDLEAQQHRHGGGGEALRHVGGEEGAEHRVAQEEERHGASSLSDLSKNRDSLEYYVSRSPGTIVELRSDRYSF